MDTYEKKLALAKEALDSGSYDKETIEYIFPELAESEGERIRKAITEFFKNYSEKGTWKAIPDVTKWIAWLEAQGTPAKLSEEERKVVEYISPELKESEDERIRKSLSAYFAQFKPDDMWDAVFSFGDILAWLEKQGEQKPADYVESTTQSYITPNQKFFQWIYDRLIYVHNENPNVDYMLSLKERIKDMQKPAWSEEDEMFVHGLIRGLAAKRDIHGHTTFSSDCIDITQTINWLKSLKERYTWKPSECQLECLGYAIEKAEKDWSPLITNRIYLTLKALKEQLEKL